MGDYSSLPEFFTIEEMKDAWTGESTNVSPFLSPTLGLVKRLTSGAKRLLKTLPREDRPPHSDTSVFELGRTLTWRLFQHFTAPSYVSQWSADSFGCLALELSEHMRHISHDLQRRLDDHPLLPPTPERALVVENWYDELVARYRAMVNRVEVPTICRLGACAGEGRVGDLRGIKRRRPWELSPGRDKDRDEAGGKEIEGAALCEQQQGGIEYEDKQQGGIENEDNDDADLLRRLDALPRGVCSTCGSQRRIYCGSCVGQRLDVSAPFLPPRFDLPFDVCLVVHFREKITTCSGIQAAVMTAPSTEFTTHLWARSTDSHDPSREFILHLNPKKHVVLFPSNNAILACNLTWAGPLPVSSLQEEGSIAGAAMDMTRKCLIVLEANWTDACKMLSRIERVRREAGLAPIACVKLDKDVVGAFWKFQDKHQSCVSTIEAITFTALAAGLEHSLSRDLLLLFRLQRARVLAAVHDTMNKETSVLPSHGRGAKIPRAFLQAAPAVPIAPTASDDDRRLKVVSAKNK